MKAPVSAGAFTGNVLLGGGLALELPIAMLDQMSQLYVDIPIVHQSRRPPDAAPCATGQGATCRLATLRITLEYS